MWKSVVGLVLACAIAAAGAAEKPAQKKAGAPAAQKARPANKPAPAKPKAAPATQKVLPKKTPVPKPTQVRPASRAVPEAIRTRAPHRPFVVRMRPAAEPLEAVAVRPSCPETAAVCPDDFIVSQGGIVQHVGADLPIDAAKTRISSRVARLAPRDAETRRHLNFVRLCQKTSVNVRECPDP